MKLDKRACRHAANVPLHISLNAGVLYTDRVKYLVTAAVKLLGGHRVLAVYFYECERLKANDRMPKWVVFQGKDDFATLERDADAKEDAEPEEKFVPKNYNGKAPKAGKGKKDKPKKATPKPAPKPADEEQLTFGDFGTEEAAG